jgi:hypothetical protein
VIAGTGGAPAALGVFTNANYASDPLGAAQERVREGYIEVIEMGTVKSPSVLLTAITHIGGVPRCTVGSDAVIVADLDPPSGDLYGSMTLVDVMGGTAYGYDAVALDEFSKTVLYTTSFASPTLADANPASSAVVYDRHLFISDWQKGIDAVNAVLATATAEAEFMRERSVAGATDIIYTMPTKPLLVDKDRASPPFFQKIGPGGACELASYAAYDRDEHIFIASNEFAVGIAAAAFCYSVTAQSMASLWPKPSAVLGSTAGLQPLGPTDISLPETGFDSGVATHRFLGTSAVLTAPATAIVDLATGDRSQVQNVQYLGLPAVGVSFIRYVNGSVNINGVGTLSNYGAGGAVRTKPDIRFP